MMNVHKQDEWSRFLDTLDYKDGLIFKINKFLLHKKSENHFLSSPNRLVYSANDNTELLA